MEEEGDGEEIGGAAIGTYINNQLNVMAYDEMGEYSKWDTVIVLKEAY